MSVDYPERRMENAYSYERVSQPQQATGRGLTRQSDAAAAWAAQHGLTLDTRLALSDAGRSASKGDHLTKGALGKFLQLAQAGQLGSSPILLVEAIDRLSRQEPLDAIETILTGLVGSGVRIITLEDGAEYSRATLRSDPTKLLVLVVKMQAAYEYSARLGMRMRHSWDKVRQQIRDGTIARPQQFCPAWCDWDAAEGFKLNRHAAVVLKIMTMLLDRGSYAVAIELNNKGLLMPSGKPWTHSTVRRLASNPAIYGAVQINTRPGLPKEIHEGLLPPVVSKAHVEQVRCRMLKRGYGASIGPTGVTHWIGQAVTSCVCGTRIAMTVSGPKHQRHKYLRCTARESKLNDCRMRGTRLREATAHLLTRLDRAQLTALIDACSQTKDQDDGFKALQRAQLRVTELEQQQANAAKAFTAAARAGVDLSTVLKLQVDLEREREQAGQQLQDAQAAVEQLNSLQADEALEPVLALQRSFALGKETAEQRQACNRALRSMGLRIVLDGDQQRMGLALNTAELDWQPIRSLDCAALYSGDTLEEVGGLLVARREADFAAELKRSGGAEIH
jgi:DNA invertase Pin-like site-specific DNA recombinase